MAKLMCAKCGGKVKMANGGTTPKKVLAKAPVNMYGIPQENMGTSSQYGFGRKGGSTNRLPKAQLGAIVKGIRAGVSAGKGAYKAAKTIKPKVTPKPKRLTGSTDVTVPAILGTYGLAGLAAAGVSGAFNDLGNNKSVYNKNKVAVNKNKVKVNANKIKVNANKQ